MSPIIREIEVYEPTHAFENEELLLRNTFINAHLAKMTADIVDTKHKKTRRLQWADAESSCPTGKPLATAIIESFRAAEDVSSASPAPVPASIVRPSAPPQSAPAPAPKKPAAIAAPKSKSAAVRPQSRETRTQPQPEPRTQGSVMEFLQELGEIGEQRPTAPQRAHIQSKPQAPPQKKRESHVHLHHAQKENETAPAQEHSKRVVVKAAARKPPLSEESNFPIRRIEPKSLKGSQRSSSAAVRRDVAQSPKPRVHDSLGYSAKKESTGRSRSNSHSSVPANAASSTMYACEQYRACL